jgi:hypothetical protein
MNCWRFNPRILLISPSTPWSARGEEIEENGPETGTGTEVSRGREGDR